MLITLVYGRNVFIARVNFRTKATDAHSVFTTFVKRITGEQVANELRAC